MVKFIGIECARDALAQVIYQQLKEDKCMRAACYFAHRTLAKSILRDTPLGKYKKEIQRDLKRFNKYWDDLEKVK